MLSVKNRFAALLSSLFLLAVLPSIASAGEYTVRPFLIDVTAAPRDIITETVKLTNESTYRKYVVYATVNEITVDTEGEIFAFMEPVTTDRTNTVTSWIEVKRGRIEIPPGEEREVPITFRINPFAQHGEYHAFVGFVPAANRPTAEKIAMDGEADGVVVKITIDDEREDSMRIGSFSIDRFVTDEDSREVEIEVENLGEIKSAPQGEIVFYDSRGEELTAVSVNTEGVEVAPGETKTLTTTIPDVSGLGRYKANLSLKYGENQKAALYDTTFFYMMPFHLMLIVLFSVVLVSLFVTYLFKRTFMDAQYQHDEVEDVAMYVRDGHDPKPQDHDIDLSKKD
tara:strand:- start:2354 stop:3373 length:1020 start_codon:yes stop_codon:yes gene_type:complete